MSRCPMSPGKCPQSRLFSCYSSEPEDLQAQNTRPERLRLVGLQAWEEAFRAQNTRLLRLRLVGLKAWEEAFKAQNTRLLKLRLVGLKAWEEAFKAQNTRLVRLRLVGSSHATNLSLKSLVFYRGGVITSHWPGMWGQEWGIEASFRLRIMDYLPNRLLSLWVMTHTYICCNSCLIS
jgi:hypothetical protein